MEPKLYGYTDWGEYIPTPWEEEEIEQEREMERIEEEARKPENILRWMIEEAPLPVIEMFFAEAGEYDTDDVVDNIWYLHRKEIVEWLAS